MVTKMTTYIYAELAKCGYASSYAVAMRPTDHRTPKPAVPARHDPAPRLPLTPPLDQVDHGGTPPEEGCHSQPPPSGGVRLRLSQKSMTSQSTIGAIFRKPAGSLSQKTCRFLR